MAAEEKILHQFLKGWRTDTDDHSESNQTFVKGINGRVYSDNGVVSFSSIYGSKPILTINCLSKILGWSAFKDELIIFGKAYKNCVDVEEYYNEDNYDDSDLSTGLYCENQAEVDIDLDVFETRNSVPNYKECSGNETSLDDSDDYDVIYSIKKLNHSYSYELIWRGNMGWRKSDKISTENIYENENIKKVYFTNYRDTLKLINLKDRNLKNATIEEMEAFQGVLLLDPIVESIEDGGSAKAGSVFFTYRLVSVNGQVSEFSRFSSRANLLINDVNGSSTEGGTGEDTTSKKVNVIVKVLNSERYNQIEMYAVHYMEANAPVIKNLGIQNISDVVRYTYYGSESDIDSNVTFAQIISRKNNWKYCADIKSINNTLYASGLRNVPVSHIVKKLRQDFALKAWNSDGNTFDCGINPKPWEFRRIPKTDISTKLYTVEKRLYTSFRVFESFRVYLRNKNTNEVISADLGEDNLSYDDYLQDVFDWLDAADLTPFPNLKVTRHQSGILFSRENPGNEDLSDYELYTDNQETVLDFEDEVDYSSVSIGSQAWEYGGVSLGYGQGNGIKITYEELSEKILKKNDSRYSGDGQVLKLEIPSDKKGFFKGEIYRLGIECQLKDGSDLFVIPLGDIQIPFHGDVNLDGSVYKNSKIVGPDLFSNKLIINASVRFSCEVKKSIKSFRLVYVERTSENKTILCQGISAPLERVLPFEFDYRINPPEKIVNKWMLPFLGGPAYDEVALELYDSDPEINEVPEVNSSLGIYDASKRVVSSRDMFYFDSPDINFGIESPEKIKNSKLSVIAKLNTDMGEEITYGTEAHSPGGGTSINPNISSIYPMFSQVIESDYLVENHQKPFMVNVSVFAEETPTTNSKEVEFSHEMNPGQVIPGLDFGTGFDMSNNAMTMEFPYWWYSLILRSEFYDFAASRNLASGGRTVFIKSKENLFTDDFVGSPFKLRSYLQQDEPWTDTYLWGYDTHALINIDLGNRESVYGGRSEYAYSKNIYIPLSSTIPIVEGSNAAQEFKVYGDSYTTLYVRNKTDYTDAEILSGQFEITGSRNKYDETVVKRFGAWCYAFVVESSIEPKYTHERRFYRESEFDFGIPEIDTINGAYFQLNNLRSSVPTPLRFKEDPEMLNIVASSEQKMSGDFYDAWTSFKINNFYELDKRKGTVYNLASYLDNLFAVQEFSTSQFVIDPTAMVQSNQGMISLEQGQGGTIKSHKVISDYGTGIRNAVKSIDNSEKNIQGFFFFDENRNEFVKLDQGMFFVNSLSISQINKLEKDKVVDAYPFYDNKYKELNIWVKLESGESFVYSYSEAMQCFNGVHEHQEYLYINWNEDILKPIISDQGLNLNKLNDGNVLNLSGEVLPLKIGFYVNEQPQVAKIFKHISGNISIKKHIDSIYLKTSLGDERVILGTHSRYRLREGFHSVPLKNRMDWLDLRGDYCYVEITLTPDDSNLEKGERSALIKIHDLILHVRNSYQ